MWALNKVYWLVERYESKCCDHFSLPLPGVCRLAVDVSARGCESGLWLDFSLLPPKVDPWETAAWQQTPCWADRIAGLRSSYCTVLLGSGGAGACTRMCKCPAPFFPLLVCFLFSMHSCQYLCNCCRPVQDIGTWIIFWIVRWFCDIPSTMPWAASVSVSTSDWWPAWQNNLSPSRGEAWLKREHTLAQTHTLIQRLYKDWLGSKVWGERGWCFRPHPKLRNGHWCL